MMGYNEVLESGKLASIEMLMLHWPFLFFCLFVCLFFWLTLGFNSCLKISARFEHQSIELHRTKQESCRDLEDIYREGE